MSPASQGGVEVERYIGSCLISSSARPGITQKPIVGRKSEPTIRANGNTPPRGCYGAQNFPSEQCNQLQYAPSGWTGAPLISMTSSPRRCNQRTSPSIGQQQQSPQQPQQQQQVCEPQVSAHLHKNPLSRLAIHTQGAPLILAGRFHNRGKIQHNTGTGNGVANAAAVCTGVNGYFHNNGNPSCAMNNAARCPPSSGVRPQRPADPKKQQTNPKSSDCSTSKETGGGTGSNITNIDSLSIASDESSGSNNSENSLPRIIKPRKRRKKDRKPANAVAGTGEVAKHEEQQQQRSSPNAGTEQSSNAVPLKPYAPCYEQRYEDGSPHLRNHRRPPIARESVYCKQQGTVQEIVDARQRYPHRHVEVKVLDDNRNVVVPAQMRAILPKGYRHNGHHHHHHHHHHQQQQQQQQQQHHHHLGNISRYIHEFNEPTQQQQHGCEESGIKDGLGPCQCRYCDPSAFIWDVDQNCYSPFLTPSTEFCPNRFAQMPLFLTRPGLNRQEQSIERLFTDNPPPPPPPLREHQEKDGCVVLRRSWSDPTSYFSEEIAAPSKDVGVIGDRGQAESGKRRTLWRGDSIGVPTSNNNVAPSGVDANGTAQTPKGLEVSTEIVTSPNGHRDLEIKFYSPSPNPPLPEEEKGLFADELDDADEDCSDIWSYHESKLQQDFRTLLQAEE